MIKLKLLILLILPCVSISQTTSDSLKISPQQVKNVYVGLKSVEVYKTKLTECQSVTIQLDSIIQSRNTDLKKYLLKTDDLNKSIETLQEEKLNQSDEFAKLKYKKIPWYKHPILYSLLGFIGGIWIMK